MGISEATIYNWRKKFGGMGMPELRRLRQLEEENQRLKRLVADLSLRDDRALTRWIHVIAETRVRYGYQRIHILLRREGWRQDYNQQRSHEYIRMIVNIS